MDLGMKRGALDEMRDRMRKNGIRGITTSQRFHPRSQDSKGA